MQNIFVIFIVLLSIFLLMLVLNDLGIPLIFRIMQKSNQVSFYDWARMIQTELGLTFINVGNDDIKEPHFILVNHVNNMFGIGSLVSVAGIVKHPCRIVTFQKYSNHLPLVASTVEKITSNEIVINEFSTKEQKKEDMLAGIQHAFDENMNVVMFIDAGDYKKPIRTLHRVVLDCFPGHQKRLIEIKERDGKVFRSYSHPPTYDLHEIIRIRTETTVKSCL